MKIAELDKFFSDLNPELREAGTGDGLEVGDPEQDVQRIATTHAATMQVLYRAADLNIDLVLSHEPAFYTEEQNEGLEAETAERKKQFLADRNMALYRVHDVWEAYPEYGILDSFAATLGLGEAAASDGIHKVYEIPTQILMDFGKRVKETMLLNVLRVSGDLEDTISRVGLSSGRRGTIEDIVACRKLGADCFIAGEASEWPATRFATDANIPVILTGHTESENFGMANMARFLKEKFPALTVEFIDAENVFSYI